MPSASVQGEVANIPTPLVVKTTVPVGVVAVPIPEESVTVAVHDAEVPTSTDPGMHVRTVVVGRATILTLVVPLEFA
jgi:hypothetical protein